VVLFDFARGLWGFSSLRFKLLWLLMLCDSGVLGFLWLLAVCGRYSFARCVLSRN
jgi:hypothetical protein